MRILTGDECGLLKETIPELCRRQQDVPNNNNISTQDGVCRVDPTETQSRSRGVVDMTFTTTSSFAAIRSNGSVEFWNATHESKEKAGKYHCTGVSHNVFESRKKDTGESTTVVKGRPIALDSLVEKSRLCAADSLGRIAVLHADQVVAHYEPFIKHQQKTISYTKGRYVNTNIATAMAVDSYGGRVAVSGPERETTLLNLETGVVVWKAKNVPPDPQTLLQHPIWTTALLFLDSNIMAAGTAYQQVRLYDVRVGDAQVRRPIAHTPEGLLSHRVTALCQGNSPHHDLIVGDAAGYLYSLDTRMMGSLNFGRFVGPAGSIRQVVRHARLPIIATVGLDRMLRTYHTSTRKQLDCVYLKQRLNCVLFCNDDTWDTSMEKREHEDADIDVEDEVQDYVDSEEESVVESSDGKDGDSAESASAHSSEEESVIDDDDDDDDDEEEQEEEESDSDSDSEAEQNLERTSPSKRRRL